MDIDLTPTPTPTSTNDTEIDTPPHTTNGAKRRHPPPPPVAVAYKECMKNHAAGIGGHAVDGCGEFMPPPPSTAAVAPAALTCAACGCHRNFHRRDPESPTSAAITPPFLDFRHPPLPKRFSLSPSPPPPPPAAAHPHVFFGFSAADDHHPAPVTPTVENPIGRKRFRTKFSQIQKEKMRSFSVKLGWKMQKSDDAAVKEFCNEIGVSKGVLKVWMHNNKNICRRESSSGGGVNNESVMSYEHSGSGGSGGEERKREDNNGNGNNFVENGNGVHHFDGSSSSPA